MEINWITNQGVAKSDSVRDGSSCSSGREILHSGQGHCFNLVENNHFSKVAQVLINVETVKAV